MRILYLFALPLSGVFLVITSLATGLKEVEPPPSRDHAVKSETAKNVLRTDDSPEDRTTRIEGPDVDLAYKIEAFMSKVGDFLIAVCKPRMARRLHRQQNRGLSSPSSSLARIVDDLKTVSPPMRLDAVSIEMKENDNKLALQQLDEVKRMAKEYYRVAPPTSLGQFSESISEPLKALYDRPHITTELSRLRDMNMHEDAETFHATLEDVGIVQAAKRFRAWKSDALRNKLGAQCEQLLFNLWIMNERKPEDVLAVLLAESSDDLNFAVDIVAHYMVHLIRTKERLINNPVRSKAGSSTHKAHTRK
uniref:RxLR effector candidate protein n=1 Tax=Peronospora matthiolae TaxID=2874970 RepID=A0AAV1USM4_9STRA